MTENIGFVYPPAVRNRRTGEVHEFGPRRAFDGAWMLEVLQASGCTKADVEGAIFVLEVLLEHDMIIDDAVPGLLKLLWGRVPDTAA